MRKKRYIFYTLKASHLRIVCSVLFVIVMVLFSVSVFASRRMETEKSGKLAIVIDDFGLQRRGVKEMLELECKLTAAIMPFLEHTEDDAEDALEHGKEIILHIPMQATIHDKPSHLGPRPIKTMFSGEEIRTWVHDALADLPEAVGANIHMGTLCSSKREIMVPLMSELQNKGLFFLDSKTSSKSVCRAVSMELGSDFYENDVFLEHESKSKAYIKKRLRLAMDIALEHGECVAIGHVGYEGGVVTATAIDELLSEFKEKNVELVFLSELSPQKWP